MRLLGWLRMGCGVASFATLLGCSGEGRGGGTETGDRGGGQTGDSGETQGCTIEYRTLTFDEARARGVAVEESVTAALGADGTRTWELPFVLGSELWTDSSLEPPPNRLTGARLALTARGSVRMQDQEPVDAQRRDPDFGARYCVDRYFIELDAQLELPELGVTLFGTGSVDTLAQWSPELGGLGGLTLDRLGSCDFFLERPDGTSELRCAENYAKTVCLDPKAATAPPMESRSGLGLQALIDRAQRELPMQLACTRVKDTGAMYVEVDRLPGDPLMASFDAKITIPESFCPSGQSPEHVPAIAEFESPELGLHGIHAVDIVLAEDIDCAANTCSTSSYWSPCRANVPPEQPRACNRVDVVPWLQYGADGPKYPKSAALTLELGADGTRLLRVNVDSPALGGVVCRGQAVLGD